MSPNHSTEKNQAVLAAFGALTAMDAVDDIKPEKVEKPVLLNDILAYIEGRSTPATDRVNLALGHNLTARRQYQQLLALNRVEHIPKPAAAHSGALFERRVGEQGVLLKLKQSRARVDQYYLIIELPDTFSVPEGKEIVLHANTGIQTQRAVFPPVHDGRTQVILSQDSALLRLLQDHDVEIDLH